VNEREWVESVVESVQARLRDRQPRLQVSQGTRLPYAHEIRTYADPDPVIHPVLYETDILVIENLSSSEWKPRLVVEAKLNSVTTHDAITYSQKAFTHKTVHPYLRYGILVGNRRHYALPSRLVRHGAYFDFMLSWEAYAPSTAEFDALLDLIECEARASRDLEEILYQSRKPDHKRYWCLYRPLHLKERARETEAGG
jgi:hypothetical protein